MIDLEKLQNARPMKDLLRFSIINLDKPTGPTSFQVSQFVKNLFDINKTSHLGTLDPMVTGVLPVALGRACRLNDYLMHRDKTYVGIMRLHKEVPEKELKSVITDFIGKINQLPPMRSRVKRAIREREVKSFEILERDGKDILFQTCVQAGTYIRKLIHDMGLELGGAHMLELRRTQAGLFLEKDAVNLYDLEKAVKAYEDGDEKPLRALLIPGEVVCSVLPTIEINPNFLHSLFTGSPIFKRAVKTDLKLEKDEKIAIVSNNKFIGCYRVTLEGAIFAVPEFVFN